MFKLFKNNPLDANIIEAIDASIEKLETYLEKTRNTRVYAIVLSNYSITFNYFMSSKNVTLVLNLTIKLQWLERNWSTEEVEKAKNWLRQSMLEYQKATRTSVQSNPAPGRCIIQTSSASDAACAQRAGLSRVMSMMRSLSVPNFSEPPPAEPSSDLVELTNQEREAAQNLEEERIVDTELQKYFAEPLITDEEELADLDIVRHWQVSLDVLPVQASSVPSERVFSSAKETDTLRRSSLSPEMMEMLQVLKYSFKSERLDFNDEWVAREEELSVVDITSEEFDHLIATGQLEELSRLIALSSSQ
ncbi:hypothetical protein H0H81_006901 [Sphagnurus paluster]|uniref:HAT C-terminal dimerisation domain-containing protein n=2 Tax=Sphagnurus paluster TaxID=117069 RepID=A0A9P7GKG5_9AGAR|nr:hypothetical protein H0H81_006901 [Sphagnurus paluster]